MLLSHVNVLVRRDYIIICKWVERQGVFCDLSIGASVQCVEGGLLSGLPLRWARLLFTLVNVVVGSDYIIICKWVKRERGAQQGRGGNFRALSIV